MTLRETLRDVSGRYLPTTKNQAEPAAILLVLLARAFINEPAKQPQSGANRFLMATFQDSI